LRRTRLFGLLVGSACGLICLAGVAGCGSPAVHLAARRRRAEAPPLPAGALPTGDALPQSLALQGPIRGEVRSAYATSCGVYAGTGFSAVLDLSLPGRVETLRLALPNFGGPGRYLVSGGGLVQVASANLEGTYAARAGWVSVAAGGTGGALSLALRGAGQTETVSGSWSCSTSTAEYSPAQPPSGPAYSEALIASGAIQSQVGHAVVPGSDLVGGAPNCGVFAGDRFNLAMSLVIAGQPYVLQVEIPQYQGAGWYYPALTPADLPINSPFAAAELSRQGGPAQVGRIPAYLWGGVGGDFSVLPGADRGRMFIRFVDRAGESLILSGAWSC
jgi:hypothetical protein